jgi:hypothetical protein
MSYNDGHRIPHLLISDLDDRVGRKLLFELGSCNW